MASLSACHRLTLYESRVRPGRLGDRLGEELTAFDEAEHEDASDDQGGHESDHTADYEEYLRVEGIERALNGSGGGVCSIVHHFRRRRQMLRRSGSRLLHGLGGGVESSRGDQSRRMRHVGRWGRVHPRYVLHSRHGRMVGLRASRHWSGGEDSGRYTKFWGQIL